MRNLKKTISGLMFGVLAVVIPFTTAFANSSSNLLTAATVAYGDSTDQTVAVLVDTAVSVAIYSGWFCGIQGLVAIIAAG